MVQKNEYFTLSLGKISHINNDSPESWSIPAWRGEKVGEIIKPKKI